MKRFSSLKYRITALITVGAILISIVIIAYNAYILKMKDDRISHSLESSLTLYCEEITTSLNNVESFLLTKCFVEEDIHKISQPRQEIDRYLAMINMQTEFAESIDNYNMLDGLFLYDASHDVFVAQSKDRNNNVIRDHITVFTKGFNQMCAQGVNGWFSVMVDDEYYLVKMFELQQVYVASFIKVSNIIGSLEEIALGESDYVVLCNRQGNVLDQRLQNSKLKLKNQSYVNIKGDAYSNLQVYSKSGDYSLAILEKSGGIFRRSVIVWSQFTVSILCILFIGIGSIFSIQRLFRQPINDLILAMTQLKDGNLEVNLEKENVFDEFKVVNETFVEMTREIKKLKIDVYEEMINKQRVELLYLQEQINPHFLTNCMNLIRNLSILGENDKVEQASILLSKYMRYSLSTSTMISLERELEHVRTYENLQRMRYGDHLRIEFIVDETLMQEFVPTMLIQTFVDNSVKHQMDQESELCIHIEIKESANKEGIQITIRDNGEGFSETVLPVLQRYEKLINDTGNHIGIYNVCQRLEILYKGCATVSFFNEPEGGAVVQIYLPNENKKRTDGVV